MLFYRSAKQPADNGASVAATRNFTAAALIAYPLGGVLLKIGSATGDSMHLIEATGLLLIVLAWIAAFKVFRSPIQRIVAETTSELDEREVDQRHRATSLAYSLFSGITLTAVLYAALANDFGWWLPTSYDNYNFLFWGGFLYAVLLPATVLAWTTPPEPEAA